MDATAGRGVDVVYDPVGGDTTERAMKTLAWEGRLLVIGFYLALNSGYYMWDGGAALGPRHCVPMLPFLALGLVAACGSGGAGSASETGTPATAIRAKTSRSSVASAAMLG